MGDLKPCPFCTDSKLVYDYYEISGPDELGTIVVCNSCGASAKPETWNTRPIEDALRARVQDEQDKATRFSQRCVELESRLDIETGNISAMLLEENKRLRRRCEELVGQCNKNYEPIRQELEKQSIEQASYENAMQITLDQAESRATTAEEQVKELIETGNKMLTWKIDESARANQEWRSLVTKIGGRG